MVQNRTQCYFTQTLKIKSRISCNWIFENYRRDFALQPDKIRAIGGGSVNAQWMQGIADITGMIVETTTQPTMAGAIGAASCAFVGSGTYKNFSEVNNFIGMKERFLPDQANAAIYDALFKSYKNVYSGLRKAYVEANLNRFAGK